MGDRPQSSGTAPIPCSVTNRWRVDDHWWRVPISRTCHTIATPTALLEVYRDDRAGDWYLPVRARLAPVPALCVEVSKQAR